MVFISRAEKNFFCFSFPSWTSSSTGLVFAVFFDGCLRSPKYPHQINCFFDRPLIAGRKRSNKNMKFENDFCFYFIFLFTTFRCRSLWDKPSDHRVMQYKEHDISLSCYSVKRRENPKVAIFICSSILSVRTLICSFLF